MLETRRFLQSQTGPYSLHSRDSPRKVKSFQPTNLEEKNCCPGPKTASLPRPFGRMGPAEGSVSNPTSAEQPLIRNRGRRSFDPLYSTLLPRVRIPFRRSRFKPILRPETGSSPRNVPTGESTQEKRGVNNFFLTTREYSSERSPCSEYSVKREAFKYRSSDPYCHGRH